MFYGHLDNVCCEEIELLTPIYSRNISVKNISMFFLKKNHIIKGPSLKSDMNISFVGWFKMHDVFRYWLPGHFWEGLYVK